MTIRSILNAPVVIAEHPTRGKPHGWVTVHASDAETAFRGIIAHENSKAFDAAVAPRESWSP